MAPHRFILTGAAALALTACAQFPDFDLRDLGNGFDTTSSVQSLPNRPAPDARGVISYPNYQVVVAERDDTIRSISTRLGLDVDQVAAFNGIEPDVRLRRDELVALPVRLDDSATAPSDAPTSTLNVEAIATTALDRVEQDAVPATPAESATTPVAPAATTEPVRHRVVRGETVFEISQRYNVPVSNIAEWNALGPDLMIREGQILLIPQPGTTPPSTAAVALPAPAPIPPAPTVTPSVAPEPAEEPVANTATARMMFPVEGTILLGYAPGRNEGIKIAASAGTNVRAADGGTIAAVTTDTSGSSIVVIRHEDGLLTVYTQMENVTVSKNERVAKGDNIGQVRDGDPSFLHFEVRRGLQSIDPTDFLP